MREEEEGEDEGRRERRGDEGRTEGGGVDNCDCNIHDRRDSSIQAGSIHSS